LFAEQDHQSGTGLYLDPLVKGLLTWDQSTDSPYHWTPEQTHEPNSTQSVGFKKTFQNATSGFTPITLHNVAAKVHKIKVQPKYKPKLKSPNLNKIF
jgi:hypothetical protein